MDKAKARARLDLSRQVIDGWEAIGMVGNRVEDKMRLIFDETQILYAIEQEHPDLADEARELGRRYSQLAMKVKLG